jgi:phenylalanyl-tRNA synthetase alpha chain
MHLTEGIVGQVRNDKYKVCPDPSLFLRRIKTDFFCTFAPSKQKTFDMINKINDLLAEITHLTASSKDELEALRIRYLSKKGEIASLMNDFRNVAAEQKRETGQKLNELKEKVQAKVNELKELLENQHASDDFVDLTRTAYPYSVGTRHPLSIIRKEICDIFGRLGFSIAEGPEIEDDWHVFSSLNFAPDHPARDMQDTFFVAYGTDILLRTHTSSVQSRVMKNTQPPIRIVCPGRVYRNEAISYRAHCFFHQVEGLYIDKNVSFADLKQVLLFFAREMFGNGTKIRLRPSFFPFTEPSAEMDISCNLCGGKGCPFCKHTGWVEILGCGMVDPNVLDNCGIDSYSCAGYAFGMGIERIANLKYQVKDLRLFSENDIRFLRQFESAT